MSTAADTTSTADTRVIPEWSLGDRLRKVRRLSGMSQGDLAEKLGTNAKTYAAWELDTNYPRNLVAVAKRIEVLSGVPAAWILGVGPDGPMPGYSTPEDDMNSEGAQVIELRPVMPGQVAPNSITGSAVADVTQRATPDRTRHLPGVA